MKKINKRIFITATIVLALLLIPRFLPAQAGFASKVFHKHAQTCHTIGTTERDYIIILNPDSTIKIHTYSSSYHDRYNTITRQTYAGTYSTSGDTIKVIFTGFTNAIKDKNNPSLQTSFKPNDSLWQVVKSVPYPSATYIVSNSEIVAVNGFFPSLNKSTGTIAMMMETGFDSQAKRL